MKITINLGEQVWEGEVSLRVAGKLKLGDVVRYVGVRKLGLPPPGSRGVVVVVGPTENVGVRFSEKFARGHSLDSRTESGYSRWFYPPGHFATFPTQSTTELELVE